MKDGFLSISQSLDSLQSACLQAGRWLTDVCQVSTEHLPNGENPRGLQHEYWKGACRGDYTVATRQWSFFCPVWHTGQAIKSLILLYQLTDDKHWLQAAEQAAGFILHAQQKSGPDHGLILAYENYPDKVNVSAVLEALDGLFKLGEVTTNPIYTRAALLAARWCRDRAWIRGEGLIRDLYVPAESRFVDRPYTSKNDGPGRPLVDDAVWLTAYQLTEEKDYRDLFYEVLDHLVDNERPSGNWIDYGPCIPDEGVCHPRHAYWWGGPMLAAWRDTGDDKWLDAAIRAGDWYIKAQRIDGGMFRHTDLSFNTPSFDQATSGTVCAAIFWMELYSATENKKWLEPIEKSLRFAISMQFTNPDDPQLTGCILEKLLPPDGTDRSPYYIRDLGTIFFVQAAAGLLLHTSGEVQEIPKDKTTPSVSSHAISSL